MNGSDKHSNLLLYGNNYGRKKVYGAVATLLPSVKTFLFYFNAYMTKRGFGHKTFNSFRVDQTRGLFTDVIYGFCNKLECLSPSLPTNIRLGWKGLPETNTVAHYKTP